MVLAVAALISIVCVLASARRLALAMTPTAYDAQLLLEELRGDAGAARFERVRDGLCALHEDVWERELLAALEAPAEVRTALVNEQLRELDYRLQRWGRVPRVAASIAASASFLLATLVMRDGLADASVVADELRGAAFEAVVIRAVDVVAVGLAGAMFCGAFQYRARKAARDAAAVIDKLVERLEALAERHRVASLPTS